MRFFRWTSTTMLFVSLAACSDTTAPRTISASFVLNDINGRSLPTFLAPTPGLTPTIQYGGINLEPSGRATVFEHRLEFNGQPTTSIVEYNYQINGRQLVFSRLEPCPPAAFCAEPPSGTFSLTFDRIAVKIGVAEPIIYGYRRGTQIIPA